MGTDESSEESKKRRKIKHEKDWLHQTASEIENFSVEQVGSWVKAALEEDDYEMEIPMGPRKVLCNRIAARAAPAAAASGFQAGGQVLGQFSFARGCALQANTVQSVIEDGVGGGVARGTIVFGGQTLPQEKDLAQLSEVGVPSATVRKGQTLAGIKECIQNCMSLIQQYINESDETGATRVPPTCAARCARGGKTTFLQKLFEKLATAGYFPIFTSFNGESPVKRRENEPADQWLYRTIAYALVLPSDSLLRQDLASKFGKRTCEESTLVTYFNSKENVVLLVDELNQLLLKSDDEAEKKAEQRASRFMKEVFLGVRGRYMVFTSHIQSTGLDLTQYMEGTSSRGLAVTGLPRVEGLQDLQHMSIDFSGLMHMRAAYYSRVPALIWTSHHDSDLLQQKFDQIHEDPNSHLSAFMAELFEGRSMRDMEAFRQLTDGSIRAGKTVWIPCFMSHFLFQCRRTSPACAVLSRWLQGMRDAEQQDGKAWEKVVAVAFGLRYIWSRMGGEHHEWLHGHDGAFIECLDASPEATSVDEAIQRLPQPMQYPTLQLVLPKHSAFEVIDLFAVRREKEFEAKLVMVAQQKEGILDERILDADRLAIYEIDVVMPPKDRCCHATKGQMKPTNTFSRKLDSQLCFLVPSYSRRHK
ncbi:unnamed protein product [Symbiodinium microadriaticum]|nr:unnamed protein product [Symbiodinium microadriaticum]